MAKIDLDNQPNFKGNREHLERLADDVSKWNKWYESSILRANLQGANLQEANLREVDLIGADLREVSLTKANLLGANLNRTNLSRADLSGTDLSGADLSGADLSGADFSGADFSGADLSGADLKSSTGKSGSVVDFCLINSASYLEKSQLETALGDSGTIIPLRIKRPSNWPHLEVHQTVPQKIDIFLCFHTADAWLARDVARGFFKQGLSVWWQQAENLDQLGQTVRRQALETAKLVVFVNFGVSKKLNAQLADDLKMAAGKIAVVHFGGDGRSWPETIFTPREVDSFEDVCQFAEEISEFLNSPEPELKVEDQPANKTVFLSYAHKDKEKAKHIVTELAKDGITCWWDAKLDAGDNWRDVLDDELGKAYAVVVLWTKNSVDRPFVRDEAARSYRDNRLVPVQLDKADVPLGFGENHCADLSSWTLDHNHPEWQRLLNGINTRFEPPTTKSVTVALQTSTDYVAVLSEHLDFDLDEAAENFFGNSSVDECVRIKKKIQQTAQLLDEDWDADPTNAVPPEVKDELKTYRKVLGFEDFSPDATEVQMAVLLASVHSPEGNFSNWKGSYQKRLVSLANIHRKELLQAYLCTPRAFPPEVIGMIGRQDELEGIKVSLGEFTREPFVLEVLSPKGQSIIERVLSGLTGGSLAGSTGFERAKSLKLDQSIIQMAQLFQAMVDELEAETADFKRLLDNAKTAEEALKKWNSEGPKPDNEKLEKFLGRAETELEKLKMLFLPKE